MRWSEAETVKFVEMYRENECLWNIMSSNYRNRDMKGAAYDMIIKGMGKEGFGVAEVKQKIKNLRCTYNQEVLKIKRSKKSGSGSADVYQPSIKWFAVMDAFMSNIKGNSHTESNMVSGKRFCLV